MEVLEKQNKIVELLINDGWQIDSVSYTGRCPVVARKNFAEIQITSEECMCHGGRIWIYDNHTNQNYEISHETYDTLKGIIDSDTELRWEIENELKDYLNKFSKFVYKLVKINEFGKTNGIDKEETTYFASMESITCRILENHMDENIKHITDYNMITEPVTMQCPNPGIKYVVMPISKEARYSWEQNRSWFKMIRYNRKDKNGEWEVEREYEMYASVFRK